MEGEFAAVSTADLRVEITTLAGHLNAANARFLALIAELARGYRRALDAEELTREAIQQRDQSLWCFTDTDGSLVIRGRAPAEIGALFKQALEAAEDSLPIHKDVPAGTCFDEQPGPRRRRVAALGILAESFLATGPRELSGGDRQQIVVHVDAETLKHSQAGRCESHRDRRERPGRAAQRGPQDPHPPSRPPSAGHSTQGIRAAASPAARSNAMWTAITSGTGPTAAKPGYRTWSRCAASITGWTGEALDTDLAVGWLMENAQRAG